MKAYGVKSKCAVHSGYMVSRAHYKIARRGQRKAARRAAKQEAKA